MLMFFPEIMSSRSHSILPGDVLTDVHSVIMCLKVKNTGNIPLERLSKKLIDSTINTTAILYLFGMN